MRYLIPTLVMLALLSAPPPAGADVTHGGKTIDCYCTDTEGARVELGQQICLFVDGRLFTARCEMSLNVPMWREMSEGCLSSSALQSRAPGPHALGVHPQIRPAES